MNRFPERPLDPPEHPEPPHYAGDCAAYLGEDDIEAIVRFDRDSEIETIETDRPWVLSPDDWRSIEAALEDSTRDDEHEEACSDERYA